MTVEPNDPETRARLILSLRSGGVTDANVLKVANGPAFKGSSVQDVFVMGNGKATRRTVQIGMTNFDYVELKSGVQKGEVIITSDMSNYKNAKEITINP